MKSIADRKRVLPLWILTLLLLAGPLVPAGGECAWLRNPRSDRAALSISAMKGEGRSETMPPCCNPASNGKAACSGSRVFAASRYTVAAAAVSVAAAFAVAPVRTMARDGRSATRWHPPVSRPRLPAYILFGRFLS